MQTPTPSPAFDESANLDFLRAVAVLLVFGTHYYDIRNGAGAQWSVAWHVGQLGVLIFFVHTCLVLMWSLDRSSQQGQSLFAPFYIRRALRIYPLSVVLVIFAYFFDARWTPPNLWQNLTLTQYLFLRGSVRVPPAVTPLWSLPLEIEMYIALPLLFLLFRNRSVKLLLAVWGLSMAGAFVLPQFGAELTIFTYVPCFLGGVMAWRLMRGGVRAMLPGWLWPLGIALASVIWMRSTPQYLPIFIAMFGMCLGSVVPLFHQIRSDKLRTASKLVARYSYGIYLSHFPIMVYVMTGRNGASAPLKAVPAMPVIAHYARPIHAVLVVGLTALASVILYHGIENPGIRLGRTIAQRVSNRSNQNKQLDLPDSWPPPEAPLASTD